MLPPGIAFIVLSHHLIQRDDANGKAFVCYSVQWEEHSTMTNSLKAYEVGLCIYFRRADIDAERKPELTKSFCSNA